MRNNSRWRKWKKLKKYSQNTTLLSLNVAHHTYKNKNMYLLGSCNNVPIQQTDQEGTQALQRHHAGHDIFPIQCIDQFCFPYTSSNKSYSSAFINTRKGPFKCDVTLFLPYFYPLPPPRHTLSHLAEKWYPPRIVTSHILHTSPPPVIILTTVTPLIQTYPPTVSQLSRKHLVF